VTLKPELGSLKIIGTDTDRYATFLLTFHNNRGPILYSFRDKRRFQSKIAKFSQLMYSVPPLKVFPLLVGTGAGVKKTRLKGLPGRERSLTMYSAV